MLPAGDRRISAGSGRTLCYCPHVQQGFLPPLGFGLTGYMGLGMDLGFAEAFFGTFQSPEQEQWLR